MIYDRDTPGARAAQRHFAGTPESRRDVAIDALAWQPQEEPSAPHVPSGMTQADEDDLWLRHHALENLIVAEALAEEPHPDEWFLPDDDEDAWDDPDTIYEPGTLAAEAEQRAFGD